MRAIGKHQSKRCTTKFTGHGYKGNIDSLNQFPEMSVAGIGNKNVTTIIFTPSK